MASVSPGDHVHSGIVAGVAVGEEIQEVGEPVELRDLARALEWGVDTVGE
jgi:hypothetical protein